MLFSLVSVLQTHVWHSIKNQDTNKQNLIVKRQENRVKLLDDLIIWFIGRGLLTNCEIG